MSNSIAKVAVPCTPMEPMKNGGADYHANAKKWNEQYFVGTVLSDELKRAARNNEAEAIDYLFTLACEGEATGSNCRSKAAAAFLYQLYQQEQCNDSLLFRQLGRDSLRLFEIVSARNAFHDARANDGNSDKSNRKASDGHWLVPPEILTMAKHVANPESQLCNDIIDQLKAFDAMAEESVSVDVIDAATDATDTNESVADIGKAATAHARALYNLPVTTLIRKGFYEPPGSRQSQAIVAELRQCAPSFYATLNAEAGDEAKLFAPDRMISSAELDVVSNALNAGQYQYRFHAARKVSEQAVNGAAVDHQLHAVLQNQGPRGMFVPLLLREHWVLFGVQSSDAGKKALVFSSVDDYLTDAELRYLKQLAPYCGAGKAAAVIMQENLQQHLPNACGLLVSQAMQHIADSSNYDAVTAVRKFMRLVANRPEQEQIAFNQQGRFELYSGLLDFYFSSEVADSVDILMTGAIQRR
jgi:hypothetical protein